MCQLLFFNSIVYGGLHRDRSICPVALWNVVEIKRLLKWIEKKGGYKSTRVSCSREDELVGREKFTMLGALYELNCVNCECDITKKIIL